jgi:hypothetical protein
VFLEMQKKGMKFNIKEETFKEKKDNPTSKINFFL